MPSSWIATISKITFRACAGIAFARGWSRAGWDGPPIQGSLKNSCGPAIPGSLVYSDGGVLRLYLDCRVNALKRNESGTCDWIVFILMRFTVSSGFVFRRSEFERNTYAHVAGQPSGDADQFEQCALLTPNFQLQCKGNAASERAAALREARPPQSLFRQTT